MDFTIVKIMNELGVSEEEARALVEFDQFSENSFLCNYNTPS